MARVLSLLALVLLSACATHPMPATVVPPYTGTIQTAVADLQRGITVAQTGLLIPDSLAVQLTAAVTYLTERTGPLLDAVAAFHAARSGEVNQFNAGIVQRILGEINTVVGTILATPLPVLAMPSLTALLRDVVTALAALQADVAHGLGR